MEAPNGRIRPSRWPKMSMMRTSLAGAAVLAAVALSACGGSGGGQTSQGSTVPARRTPPAARPGPLRPPRRPPRRRLRPTSTGATGTATQTGTQTANSGGAAIGGRLDPVQGGGPGALLSRRAGGDRPRRAGLRAQEHRLERLRDRRLSGDPVPGRGRLGPADDPAAHHRRLLRPPAAGPAHPAPGQTASFRLGVSHGGGSSAACSTADALQVIAPNDTATLKVPIPNGASECGTTTVSPLQPGTSAYQ